MTNLFKKFLADASGATMVEYGVIASLIVTIIVGGVTPVANNLSGTWATFNTNMAG